MNWASLFILSYLCFDSSNCRAIERRSSISKRAVDLTLAPGSSGEDVVTACIQKIESLNIFSSDFGLMKRIAKYESDFGTNYASKDQSRGIWQIPYGLQEKLEDVTAQFILSKYIDRISQLFSNHVSDFTKINYSTPLHAAVSVRLYIQLVQTSKAVPGTLTDQATWWASNYNVAGSTMSFVETITDYEATKTCSAERMDLWFCIDGSGSIGIKNFQTSLSFVRQVTAEFNISPDKVRTGMTVYSSEITTVSRFNQHTSDVEFSSAVNATFYPGGGTRTGAAISDVTDHGFNVGNGARPTSQGVPRVLIVLTDGRSHDDVVIPAFNARAKGITVFAVGVGNGIEPIEINEIASDPDSTCAFTLSDFNALLTILKQVLSEETCKASAVIPNDTVVYVSVSPGNTYFSSIKIPVTGYLTVTFVVANDSGSAGVAYIGTLPNPSSALNIAVQQLRPGVSVSFTVSADGVMRRKNEIVLNGRALNPKATTIPIYASIASRGVTSLRIHIRSVVAYASPIVLSNVVTTDVITTTSRPTTTDVMVTMADVIAMTGVPPHLQSWITIIIVIGTIIGICAIATIAFVIYMVTKRK